MRHEKVEWLYCRVGGAHNDVAGAAENSSQSWNGHMCEECPLPTLSVFSRREDTSCPYVLCITGVAPSAHG